MNEKNFIVVQKGVYIHDIFGPFNSLEEAKERAFEKINEEEDDYHEMIVKEAVNGEYITIGGWCRKDTPSVRSIEITWKDPKGLFQEGY